MATWWCLWWYPIHERFCIGHIIILWYLPELRHRLLPLLCVFRVPKNYFSISQRFHLNWRRIGDANVITDHARLLFGEADWIIKRDSHFFDENHMQQIYLRTYVPVFFRTYWSLSLKLVDLVYLLERIRIRIMWKDQNENNYWHQFRLE